MSEQLRILELIEVGEISAEEGARRLVALTGAAETTKPPEPPAVPRPALVRWLWQGAFWTGVALLAGGGLLMASVYSQGGTTGGLVWGWILFIFGVLVTLLGWWLQRAHWLCLRVRQHDGPNVTLALPLPLGLIAWGLRIARPFVPQLEETGVDEVILAMREEIRDGHPFVVEVNEREGGERVQVYFG